MNLKRFHARRHESLGKFYEVRIMPKPSPMQMVRELTKKDKPVEAKKAFAGSLAARNVGTAQSLQKLSNSKLLRLARRHAPELLGAFAPKPKPEKAAKPA